MDMESGSALRQLVGRNLRAHRNRAKLPRSRVANALDTDVTTLYRWETGRHLPRPHQLERLAELYGVSVSDFYVERPDDHGATAAREIEAADAQDAPQRRNPERDDDGPEELGTAS